MPADQARMLAAARAEPLWPRPPVWTMALGVFVAAGLARLSAARHVDLRAAHHDPDFPLCADGAVLERGGGSVRPDQPRVTRCSSASAPMPSACSCVKFGITPWVGIVVGMLLSALAAVAIGVPTLRLKGHYFAIATLLIGSSVQIIFQRWDWVGAASGPLLPINRSSPVALSAVPHQQGALLLPGAGRRGAGVSWSCGSCAAAASASACRPCATTPTRPQASASPSPGTRCWPS